MQDNIFNFNNNNDNFEPATDKQMAMLTKLGYQGNTVGLTKGEASQIIKSMCEANQQAQAQQNQNTKKTTYMEDTKTMEKQPTQNQVAKSTGTKVAEVKEKNISDVVINQINNLVANQGLMLPQNYVAENALKSAYLKLAESNLLTCDQTSIAEALLNMCIQGLNPAKNQCYFINYANKVQMMRSYFGDRAVAINTGLVKDIQANVIYEGDLVNVEYVNDYMVVHHQTDWQNFGKPIVGAYAFAVMNDGTKRYAVLTMERIKKSWSQSKNQTNNKLQKDFPDEACKRTVIRNLVKNLFNTTLDQNLIVESYNNTTSDEYENEDFKKNSIGDVNVEQESSGTKDIEVGLDD